MIRCVVCGKNINEKHGNSKHCTRHSHAVKPKYQEQMVQVPLSRFRKMLAAEKYLEFLERLES